LDNSLFMVVLLTESGIKSQWVNQEIGYAHALQRKNKEKPPFIIPVSRKNLELRGLITKDTMIFCLLITTITLVGWLAI
jgi:hypothetical protein